LKAAVDGGKKKETRPCEEEEGKEKEFAGPGFTICGSRVNRGLRCREHGCPN